MSEGVVLDLCGGLGSRSRPYAEAGYEVHVFTLERPNLPDWKPHPNQDYHFCDVRLLKTYDVFDSLSCIGSKKVRGVLCAPPCTMFSLARTKVPDGEDTRAKMVEAMSVVDACIRICHVVRPKWWALENPAGKLVHWLGKPLMYFQPWEYGDAYTKKTALWGKFTPPGKWFPKRPEFNLVGGGNAASRGGRLPSLTLNLSSRNRAAVRAVTPAGFAKAFFEANP